MPTPIRSLNNQPIALGILAQLSYYKRKECNLLAEEKGPQSEVPGSCLVKHLYL